MATSSNLSSIIRYYAEKQNSPFIDFREFCLWIKKYAEKKVEDQAELVKYLGDPTNTLLAELAGLEEKHIAAINTLGNKKVIVSVSYVTTLIEKRYEEILKDLSKPFPSEIELPKKFPISILERKKADLYIPEEIDAPDKKSSVLYALEFSRELPPILMPSNVPIKTLLEIAQKKIIKIVKKEEFHDYLNKKLRSSSPNREISIKHFFAKYIDPENNEYHEFSDNDDYYLWNQLCYYLRLDFEKIQDRTIEDTNILQSVQISEINNTYLKQKIQLSKRREEALKELKDNLLKAPFYYSQDQILKFHDKNGRLLYGQYSEDDLKDFITKESTEAEQNVLPSLLVFKVASDNKYYVYKENVIPLVVRLCNEAHVSVETYLTEKWYKNLLEYNKLPEMTHDDKFEAVLEQIVEDKSPVLYALLTAKFMASLAYEKSADTLMDSFQIFNDDKLLPYSRLLLLKRESILSHAKAKLPFIYSLPVLSWFIGLFRNKKKIAEKTPSIVKNPFEEEPEVQHTGQKLTRQQALAEQAIILSKELIPEGSNLDRELNFLITQWNKMIGKENRKNLTDDVNSLIRDYTRRVLRTVSASSLTKQRLESLAENLVKTPNMQRIGEEKVLKEYIELYMLRLVSNSK